MDIQIIDGQDHNTRVIIQCETVNEEILRLRAYIDLFHFRMKARLEQQTVFVELSEVLYFESVDNRTFLYTAEAVLEIKHKLYELEELLPTEDFFRSSKSQIVNINQIKAPAPYYSGLLMQGSCCSLFCAAFLFIVFTVAERERFILKC